MKLVLVFMLVVLLSLNVTESRSNQVELIKESVKLWTSIKEIWNRFENRCRYKIRNYLEEDQLGEKLAAILNIYLKRLNMHLSTREE
uniref:Uncharacterized protein n=1 Tax=Schistosoma japonicum TaxID=6182 RepID=C1L4B9_SCHJA|nr:hypothetical protein [Schistosoma japonicum]